MSLNAMGHISKTAHFRTWILWPMQGLRMLSMYAKAQVRLFASGEATAKAKMPFYEAIWPILEDVPNITHFSHRVFMDFLTYFI